MNLSRRNILMVGASSVLAAAGSEARSQQGNRGMDTMPTPEQMQVVQRGGLYANLHDPNIRELPADAFAQRFTYSPAPKASPITREGHNSVSCGSKCYSRYL